MNLPTIPREELTIKSKYLPKGAKVSVMPFSVAEEKILLQMRDTKNIKDIYETIGQLTSRCVKSNVDIYQLPTFVVDLLFLRMRQLSIGETIEPYYECDGEVIDEEGNKKPCENKIQLNINLKEVDIHEEKDHKSIFKLTETIGIKMKYPCLNDFNGADESDPELEKYDSLVYCIDSIFDGDSVYPAEDYDKNKLDEFVQSIDLKKKMEIVRDFINRQPSVQYTIKTKCSQCGKDHTIKLSGLHDFFG